MVIFLKKLINLNRVTFKFKVILFIYYIGRTFKIKASKLALELNTLLHVHLLRYNGYLIDYDNQTHTSDYNKNLKNYFRLTIRKYPSSDFWVFDNIFQKNEYGPLIDLIQKFGMNMSENLNIIDAGGNIGAATIFLNMHLKNPNFIIIEPDEQNLNILEQNINQNKISHVKIIKGGIWKKDGYLSLDRNFRDKNDWAVQVVESEEETDLKAYSVKTLIKMMGFKQIDIFKIDIEGAEKELFEDSEQASDFLRITKIIAIEIHDEFDCRKNIYNCLDKNNFVYSNVGEYTIGYNKDFYPQNKDNKYV